MSFYYDSCKELSFSKLNENLSAERGKHDGSRETAEKSSLKKRKEFGEGGTTKGFGGFEE